MQTNDSSLQPDEPLPPARHEVGLGILKTAIKKDLKGRPAEARSDAFARAFTLLLDLEATDPEWPGHRAHIMLGLTAGMYQEEEDNIVRKLAEENRPALLQRKGFERVRAVVMVKTPTGMRPVPIGQSSGEEKRAATKLKQRRLATYRTPRVSPKKLKELEAEVSQDNKYDRQVIPMTAGDKQMTLDLAMDLYEKKQESPLVAKAKKAIKVRWDRQNGPTKNQ